MSFESLDPVDARIIALLRKDARMTARALADSIGIAEPTVANRIKSLHSNGVMRVLGLVSHSAAGRPIAATIGIRILGRSIDEIASDIVLIEGVVSVMSVLGRFDLFVGVTAIDLRDLREVLETQIGAIKGVENIECMLSLETIKYSPLWAKF